MANQEIFNNLKSLQDILVEKYDLEEKVQNAPKQLQVQDAALARSKKEYIAINTDYDEVKDVVLKLKAELEAAVKSREEGEKGMDNITTHREYEALEKQINEATARENDLRHDLQQNEKKLAELNENLKNKEESINFQESELNTSRESLDKEIAGYNQKLAELKAQEDQITPNLNQEVLFKFERIIQRNSEGIVSVKNGVCSGCHMILPAQFANVVRQSTAENADEEINFCPYCSRILFYEEVAEEDQEDASFNFNAAGSLSAFDDDDDDLFDDDDENEKSYDDEDDNGFDRIDDDESDDLDDEDDVDDEDSDSDSDED